MKKIFYNLFLLATFTLASCGGECPVQKELTVAQADLAEANAELENLKKPAERVLVHTVYLKTKPDLVPEQKADLVGKLKSLSTIQGILEVRIGEPAETGDPRLNSDYNYVLYMKFASEADLAAYQKNDLHLKSREATKDYMAGPPVVFDYWLE
jgi:hypothetical protein